jgi:hypothetical protein
LSKHIVTESFLVFLYQHEPSTLVVVNSGNIIIIIKNEKKTKIRNRIDLIRAKLCLKKNILILFVVFDHIGLGGRWGGVVRYDHNCHSQLFLI